VLSITGVTRSLKKLAKNLLSVIVDYNTRSLDWLETEEEVRETDDVPTNDE